MNSLVCMQTESGVCLHSGPGRCPTHTTRPIDLLRTSTRRGIQPHWFVVREAGVLHRVTTNVTLVSVGGSDVVVNIEYPLQYCTNPTDPDFVWHPMTEGETYIINGEHVALFAAQAQAHAWLQTEPA